VAEKRRRGWRTRSEGEDEPNDESEGEGSGGGRGRGERREGGREGGSGDLALVREPTGRWNPRSRLIAIKAPLRLRL
jgi:hypothetical protein